MTVFNRINPTNQNLRLTQITYLSMARVIRICVKFTIEIFFLADLKINAAF